MNDRYVVGIDIGGTKISTAVCDFSGKIIIKKKIDTLAIQGPNIVVGRIIETIRELIREMDIPLQKVTGIGLGSPGPLSIAEGKIVYIASIGWKNVPIRDLIYNEFKVFTVMENDCNAAAYSEALLGAGKGNKNVIYVTVSTGVGCGIIINGEIYHGKHDAAGEFGHICIEPDGRDCTCGNKGCLQAYASGPSISKIAKESIIKGEYTKMVELSKELGVEIDCPLVEQAALQGDKLAAKIWAQMGQRLGHGISILIQLLDPDIVVIGGGVAKAWKLFYDPMLRSVKKHTYKCFNDDIRIVPAELGQDAGVIGAALLAIKGVKDNTIRDQMCVPIKM